MSLDDEKRKQLVELYWSKSEATLEELTLAVEGKKWNMAANRLYYALFHAVSALFIKDGRKISSHRGAKQTIGQYYVLSGKLTPEEGHFYAQMESLRERADYDVIFRATQEEIEDYLPQAYSFVNSIKRLLERSECGA